MNKLIRNKVLRIGVLLAILIIALIVAHNTGDYVPPEGVDTINIGKIGGIFGTHSGGWWMPPETIDVDAADYSGYCIDYSKEKIPDDWKLVKHTIHLYEEEPKGDPYSEAFIYAVQDDIEITIVYDYDFTGSNKRVNWNSLLSRVNGVLMSIGAETDRAAYMVKSRDDRYPFTILIDMSVKHGYDDDLFKDLLKTVVSAFFVSEL